MAKIPHLFTKKYLMFWALAAEMALIAGLLIAFRITPKVATVWLENLSNNVFAVPVIVLLYCIAAFISVPQILLSTGVLVSFGPVKGSIIIWASILMAASATYLVGRRYGQKYFRKMGKGKAADKILGLMEKHGFITCLSSRIVPSGPFLLVNMAAGISDVRYREFIIGTALGIIPKIAILAFLTGGVKGHIYEKDIHQTILYFSVALLCAIAFLLLHKYLKAHRERLKEAL